MLLSLRRRAAHLACWAHILPDSAIACVALTARGLLVSEAEWTSCCLSPVYCALSCPLLVFRFLYWGLFLHGKTSDQRAPMAGRLTVTGLCLFSLLAARLLTVDQFQQGSEQRRYIERLLPNHA